MFSFNHEDEDMTIKVLITRRIPEEKRSELLPLLIRLRKRATSRPGYISGQTLQNYEDPEDVLVIGSWQSVDSWIAWRDNPERRALQEEIDRLLPAKTEYKIYQWG